MKLQFWKKDDDSKDKTCIKVTTSTGGSGVEIYVEAQTSDKALEIYRKLSEKNEHSRKI